MKRKKWAALLVCAALSLSLLAGCGSSGGEFSSFSAKTLDGESFTQKDIQAKDVTVVNFWGTFCGPCIAEMPDLTAYSESLPDNVQLITICLDGANNVELAKAILDQAGYQGVTLLSGDQSFANLCFAVQSVPTTMFVDSKGVVCGDPIIGRQKDLAGAFTERVNQVLKAGGKPEIAP